MTTRKEENALLRKWIRPIGFGTLSGAVGCLVALLLLAALLTAQEVPTTAVTPMALVAAVFGAFSGGFTAARIAGQNGWLMGLLTGMLLFLLLLVAGGFALFDEAGESHILLKLTTMLVSAAVGGIVALNVGKRRR